MIAIDTHYQYASIQAIFAMHLVDATLRNSRMEKEDNQ